MSKKTKRPSPDGPSRKRSRCVFGGITTDYEDEDQPIKKLKLSDRQSDVLVLEPKQANAPSLGTPLSTDSGHDTLMSPQNLQPCSSVDSGKLTMSPSIGTLYPWSVDGHTGEDNITSIQQSRQTTELKESPKDCSNSRQVRLFIQRNFSLLKEELVPGRIPGYLYQEGVIDRRMYEAIEAEKRRENKCEQLLLALSYDKYEVDDMIQILKRGFKHEGYEYLVKDIDNVSDEQMVQPVCLPGDAERRLNKHEERLESDLDPEVFIDQLVDDGVLSIADHSNIKNVAYRPEKVQVLIKYVKRDIERNYAAFCEAIKVSYCHIHRLLTEEDKDNGKDSGVLLKMQMTTNPVLKYSETAREDESSKDLIDVCFQLGGCDEDETVRKRIEEQIVKGRSLERLLTDRDLKLHRQVNKVGTKFSHLSIGSIKLKLFTNSHKAKSLFLKKCLESPVFLQDVLRGLIAPAHVQRLREANIDNVDIDVAITFPEHVPCTSVLTKELIVKQFTYIEEHLKYIDAILKEFVTTEQAVGGESTFSKLLLESSTHGEKNGRFLMKVLSMPEFPSPEDFGLCVLERKLRESKQMDLLKHIMSSDCPEKALVTTEDIRRNYSLIQNEIEPRRFITLMQTILEDKGIHELILSTPKRKDRCQVLLDFVFRTGQSAVTDFMTALEIQGLSHLIETITASAQKVTPQDEEHLRETLLSFYEEVETEIEPLRLLPFLKQRQVFSEEDASAMSKLSTRNQRTVWLMKKAVEIPRVSDMVECLELGGYMKLAKSIYSRKDDYRDCPRHTKDKSNAGETVLLKTSFKIGYVQSEPDQSMAENEHVQIDNSPATKETRFEEMFKAAPSVFRKCFTENWITTHMGTFTDALCHTGESIQIAHGTDTEVSLMKTMEEEEEGIDIHTRKTSKGAIKPDKEVQNIAMLESVVEEKTVPCPVAKDDDVCCKAEKPGFGLSFLGADVSNLSPHFQVFDNPPSPRSLSDGPCVHCSMTGGTTASRRQQFRRIKSTPSCQRRNSVCRRLMSSSVNPAQS